MRCRNSYYLYFANLRNAALNDIDATNKTVNEIKCFCQLCNHLVSTNTDRRRNIITTAFNQIR